MHETDLYAFKLISEEYKVKKKVLVCLEKEPRRLAQGIEVLPWKIFLEKLWAGELV